MHVVDQSRGAVEACKVAQLAVFVTPSVAVSMGSIAATSVGLHNALGSKQPDSIVLRVAEVEVVDVVAPLSLVLLVLDECALIRAVEQS